MMSCQPTTLNASLFVFPSFYEGFGIPIVEAMASGVATACSNTSSLPEVGGDAALYFDPKSPKDISDVMYKILKDPVQRGNMCRLGFKQIKKFDWRNHAQIIQTSAEAALKIGE